jgi:hypothetical protein
VPLSPLERHSSPISFASVPQLFVVDTVGLPSHRILK